MIPFILADICGILILLKLRYDWPSTELLFLFITIIIAVILECANIFSSLKEGAKLQVKLQSDISGNRELAEREINEQVRQNIIKSREACYQACKADRDR